MVFLLDQQQGHEDCQSKGGNAMSANKHRLVNEYVWRCGHKGCQAKATIRKYACGKVDVVWIVNTPACPKCNKAPLVRSCPC